MESIGGLVATGRKLRGPGSDLVELDSPKGLKHTAVQFHPEYRSHNAINDALSVVRGFLESPMVTGLVELVRDDPNEGAFIYPTGQVWSVAEVIRTMADLGEPAGVRAGLELMFAAGRILVEAADTGANQGVYSHGGLTPWRCMLRRNGEVLIIGHALPQVEILLFHEDPSRIPREDSFRYCPPERMESAAEDVSSDLFGLTLVAFELMTGKPVYDGLVNDIRQQAARGEGSRRLYRFREILPQRVRDLLSTAMKPATSDRFSSGEEFLTEVRAVLSSADATGPSLIDLMAHIGQQNVRTGTAVEASKTTMTSREELQRLVGAEDDEVAEASGRGAREAWSPAPARGGDQPQRRSPRRAGESGDGPAASVAAPPAAAPPPAAPPPDLRALTESQSRWSKPNRGNEAPARAPEPPPRAPEPAGPRPAAPPRTPEPPPRMTEPPRAQEPPRIPEAPRAVEPPRTFEPAHSIGGGPRAGRLPPRARPEGEPEPVRRGGVDIAELLSRVNQGAAAPVAPVAPARPPPDPAIDAARPEGPARRVPLRERLNQSASLPPPVSAAPPPPPPSPPPPSPTVQTSPASAVAPTSSMTEGPGLTEAGRPRFQSGRARVPEPTAPAGASPSEAPPADAPPVDAAPVVSPPAVSAPVVAPVLQPPEPVPLAVQPAPAIPPASFAAQGISPVIVPPAPVSAPPAAPFVAGLPVSAGPPAELPLPVAPPLPAPPPPVVAPPTPPSPAPAAPPSDSPGAAASGASAVHVMAAASVSGSGVAGAARAAPAGSGAFTVRRADGRVARSRLPSAASSAEGVSMLVGTVFPVRLDLAGRLAGWYRMEQGGVQIPADRRMFELDPEREITFRFVPNDTIIAEIEVRGADLPHRFKAPVGTAVLVTSMVDHLITWLELGPGEWGLLLNGRSLEPHGILQDALEPGAPVRLLLSRVNAR